MTPPDLPLPADYADWLASLKQRIAGAQQRATVAVNTELVMLYWDIGHAILDKQQGVGWGAKVVERIALDLRNAFPAMKGFSRSNLLYMRALAEAWRDRAIVQQLVGQLPWGHNIVLLTKLKDTVAREWYARAAIAHGWSRAILDMQIETGLYEREGRALTNFAQRLPAPQSDLATATLKDPYIFDFLGLGREANERAIEDALVDHIVRFLLELGAGFAFVGRQVHLEVGGDDFYVDLLFYHLKLRCYVVIELKATAFKPEYAGQLNFYLSAADALLKTEHDQPTIGLLLCRSQNRVVAEYALKDIAKPIGIAEYNLVRAIPEDLATKLPTIEQIEAELQQDAAGDREDP
ncbi:DUF1016 domain-containing protein [Herbaspirillum sp. HC18]|nr:DUF1016 domain-containing protein [Herbaspirillum sp. HC18]